MLTAILLALRSLVFHLLEAISEQDKKLPRCYQCIETAIKRPAHRGNVLNVIQQKSL